MAGALAEEEEEILDWDSGLSRCLGKLEENLIRWHSEERTKLKERQAACRQTQEDVAAVEAALRGASEESSSGQPWQEQLGDLLRVAIQQRDELGQICELLRSHTQTHLASQAGGAELLQQFPEAEGQAFDLSGDELQKLLCGVLELADSQPANGVEPEDAEAAADEEAEEEEQEEEEDDGRDDAPEDGGEKKKGRRRRTARGEAPPGRGTKRKTARKEEKEKEKEKSNTKEHGGEKERGRPTRRRRTGREKAKERPPASEAYSDDDYSSYSPPPERPRRRRGEGARGAGRRGEGRAEKRRGAGREGRGEERRKGGGGGRRGEKDRERGREESADSASYSYSQSRERKPRRRRTAALGRGGGRDRGEKDGRPDIAAEIDRFLRVNKLDGRCEKAIREIDHAMAAKVMGLTGGNKNTFELSGDIRDPTAVVLARIRKARDEASRANPRGGGGGGGGGGGRHRRRGHSGSSRSRSARR